MKKILIILLTILICTFTPFRVFAQTYYFNLRELIADVYLNSDGSASIDYVFTFANDPSASPIDYVDVGLPNGYFSKNDISAEVNGLPIHDISASGYQGSGTGVALGLGANAIQPGQTSQVHVRIGKVDQVLRPDSKDPEYASAVFSPTWFGSEFLKGNTDMTVVFHLPPGVQPEEPRWHSSPAGWPSEPETGFDEQNNITYAWRNPEASGFKQYKFGASIPRKYIPAEAIITPSVSETLGTSSGDLFGALCCPGTALALIFLFGWTVYKKQSRKMQYLPPKVSIEGHGIKRGLTAVEAAILLEQPLDKILTMILFSTIKKEAATVTQRDPLTISVSDTLPEGLHNYEIEFLKAFQKPDAEKRIALQDMFINLVQSTSNKMKGFSRSETIDYYKFIVQTAWQQVKTAETPEVRSEKYDDVMEWTMLDEEYEDKTKEIFRTDPVFIPRWWPRYDPVFRKTISSTPSTLPTAPDIGGQIALPTLPGSDFAASMVNGAQSMATSVVGDITNFTKTISQKTNPVPEVWSKGSSGRTGSGGCVCACACACAGCACACAGGGR